MCRRKLASTAITYGITGEATFNVLNIADFMNPDPNSKLTKVSSGLFEVSLSKDKGFSARLGTGGVDLSFKNLKSAISGIKAVNTNIQINKVAKQSNMKNAATALRMQYGFGDETQLANLDSILKGQSVLKAGTGAGEAQTITENGKRTIYLNNYKENMTREEKLAMGITIGHEAYRDGITGDTQSQYIETVNAVLGHTVMAKKMQNDSLYKSMMNDVISTNQNLQNDLAVFDYAATTGDWGAFGGYVGANYDSSADYWKLKMYADGTHELIYDGEKELSIDYLNENGELISTSVPEKQDMSDVGMAGSLGKILGIERVDELLGSSYLNADNYDFNTLKDVLKLSDNQIAKIQRTGSLDGIELTESQKYSLVGEAIIKNSGASWNGSSWINTEGISLTITDKAYNGNIMAEVQNGKYLYSTVNATLFRDPDSWRSIEGTPNKDDPTNEKKVTWKNDDDYSNLDVRVFTKTGINWEFNESYVDRKVQSIDNMFQSVSNPEKSELYNQPYYDTVNQRWVQGNTIVSEYYNMQYFSTSGSYEGSVLVKNNAWTIDGNWVGNDGKDSRSGDRWLSHANRKNGSVSDWYTTRSDGCDIESYINHQAMLEIFKKWNISDNYQIRTQLINQKYGGY